MERISAEAALLGQLRDFQFRAQTMWRGREKEAVIALVRALDGVSLARLQKTGRLSSAGRENSQFFSLLGAATALRPFLAAIKDQPGGVPWGPLGTEVTEFAYSYLDCCGKLAFLRRMASLERYDLARTSWLDGRLVIEVKASAPEMALQSATRSSKMRSRSSWVGEEPDEHCWRQLHRRMMSYVDSSDGWFIRYDNDSDIVSAYQWKASSYGSAFMEGEALPDDVAVGERTFGEWRKACDQALGRVLCHIDFAQILRQKNSKIALGNVTTIFARREDVAAVWCEAGLSPERVDSTMQALTLSIDGLDFWERAYDIPCPFYVDLGRDFVLLPCFGALSNPYFSLFQYLRNSQRADWDRGVDRREEAFRSDLKDAFAEPRFHVPTRGFKLRRSDGSLLTDVDAVISDRDTGRLAVVQLKWHDVFGYSLTERDSRRRNILQANDWVERVSTWINGRSSADIAVELGLPHAGVDAPPAIFVVARYAARFAGEADQDPRAAWLGWYEILRELAGKRANDPLADIPKRIAARQSRFERSEGFEMQFHFPNLSVDLRSLD